MPIPFINNIIINYNQNTTNIIFDYISNDTDDLDDNDYYCTLTRPYINWGSNNSTSIYN